MGEDWRRTPDPSVTMVLSVLICALRVTGMIIYSECETIGSVD